MKKSLSVMISLGMVVLLSAAIGGCGVVKKTASTRVFTGTSAEDYLSGESKKDASEEYVLAQQTGVLGEDWSEFTVQLNSVVVTLPCNALYLEGIGLEMDTSLMSKDTIVNGGNRESVYFQNEFGDAILVTLMNPNRTPRALHDCLVTGIAVTEYDLDGGHLNVTFPGGVELYSDKSKAIRAYGSDYEEYQSDSVHMCTWHVTDSYYKSCEIDYDTASGRAIGMFINF